MRKLLRCAPFLAAVLAACDQERPGPAAPQFGHARPLLTANDSAAALLANAEGSVGIQSHQTPGVVAIHAGETVVVTVSSVETSRCESVGVTGVISQALFPAVGSCGGTGLSITIGPAPSDGNLFFALTSSPASQSMVSGQFPDYSVGLDDGLFDADFNDVILGVHIQETVALSVVCQPATPTRGAIVTCTTSLAVPSAFTVVERQATGRGFRIEQTTPIPHAAGEVDRWEGEAVATTDVSVTVEVAAGGRTRQLREQATFTVAPRAWPGWQFTNVTGPFIGLAGRMRPTPQVNRPIGVSAPEIPDLNALPLATPAAGPNTGLSFIPDPVILDTWQVGIHPALEPTPAGLSPGDPGYMPWHAWYDDQNGIGGGTCGPADIARLRQEVERHEGLTLAPNSHLGVANTVLAAERPERRLESLYTDVSQAELRTLIQGELTNFFNRGAYRRAQDRFDRQDTPTVFAVLGCTLDFNLRDP